LRRESEAIVEMVFRCAQNKAEIVSEDETEEKGLRLILNFGHTVAHALEASLGYGILTHGEAVSLGMCAEAHISESSVAKEPVTEPLRNILSSFGLPTILERKPKIETFLSSAYLDKKSRTGYFNLVLLEEVGKAKVMRFSQDEYEQALRRGLRSI
jgi:3-dehydroquinate synthase